MQERYVSGAVEEPGAGESNAEKQAADTAC